MEDGNDNNNSEIKPPVGVEKYKESLKKLTRETIIKRCMEAGQSYEDAVEFADELDKDRKEFGLE